jgi:hypothetical protein
MPQTIAAFLAAILLRLVAFSAAIRRCFRGKT